MSTEVKRFDPADITAPRLVHLKKGDKGYGFNLHSERGVQGQTISAVDEGSPAESGGLREGDRVVEVNGKNVDKMKHGEVVSLIKENPTETSLLVIDSITDKYLKDNEMPITADMANLKTVYVEPETDEGTPEQKTAENDESQEVINASSAESESTPSQVVHQVSVQSPSRSEAQPSSEVQQGDNTKHPDTTDIQKAMASARPQGKSKRDQKAWNKNQKAVFEAL